MIYKGQGAARGLDSTSQPQTQIHFIGEACSHALTPNMTTTATNADLHPTMSEAEAKHDVVHADDVDALKKKAGNDNEFIEDNAGFQSIHGDLGIVKTIWTFKWACACAFLAGIGAMSDGYQYSLPGNLLPNPGFIEQFGVPGLGPNGTTILDPNHVAAWGGEPTP